MKKYVDWEDVKRKGVELYDDMRKRILSGLSGEPPEGPAEYAYRGKQMPTREAGKYLRTSVDMIRNGLEEKDSEKVAAGLFRVEVYIARNSNRIISTSHYHQDSLDLMTPEQRAPIDQARRLREAIGPINVRTVDLVRKVRAEASGGKYYVRKLRKKAR